MKEKIKRILKSSKFGKILYPLFQKAYRIYSVPKKRRLLRKNGDVILKIIDKAFQGAGIEYFVDFGTLLGVIREGDFLKHDDDIDITICSPDINSHFVVDLLLKEGFSFIHSLEYKGKSRIVALDYKVHLLIFILGSCLMMEVCIGGMVHILIRKRIIPVKSGIIV